MTSTLKTARLLESEQPLSELLSIYPLPTWIIHPGNFEIAAFNKAAVELYGFSAAEWVSLNFLDLFTEQGKVVFFHKAKEVKKGDTIQHTTQQLRKDASCFIVGLHLSHFEIDSQSYFLVTAVDITNNEINFSSPSKTDKKNEEKINLLANLVEQTSDILTAADVDYKPITWNKAAEKIYGITAEQAIGSDLRKFISVTYCGVSREEVRRLITQNGEWRGEAFFVRPTDKKTVFLWMYFKALFNEEAKHLGYLISAIDITERKETESKLIESENRFREMADSSPVMIWMCDDKNETTYINKNWVGFTGKDIVGIKRGWSFLVHIDDIAKAKADFHKAFEARKKVALNYRLLSANGTYRWVHDVSVPRFLDDGTFVGYIGTLVDVEDEKQKEKQLLYQAMILDNVSDVIITTNLDHQIISWNCIAEACYEMEAKDVIGKKMSELIEFTFCNGSLQNVVHHLAMHDRWEGEASFVNKNGQTKHYLYSVKGIYDDTGHKLGYLSTGRDITDRRQTEEKMKMSEQFYRTLIADSLDGMILVNAEGLITFSSASVKNVLGFEADEIIGRNAFEFVHPQDLVWAFESFQREVVENPEVKFITVRLLKKNGDWLWSSVRGHNLLSNPGVNSMVIYFHDDTLRKQASDALKESEKRFRSLIRDLQLGVFLSDGVGNVIMSNQAMSTLLSVSEADIIGKNVYDILPGEMIDEKGEYILPAERPLSLAIRSKQPVKDVVIGMNHPLTKERCWIMVNADPMLDENGEIKHIVCSMMDLTERKKLESQLVEDQVARQKQVTKATIEGQEAERREIGKELHDNIGQQLTTIKLYLDLAKSTADDATNEMVNLALKGVSDVINEVRAMSRSLVPSTLQDLGLVESIQELMESFVRTLPIKIDFVCDEFDEEILSDSHKLTLFRIVQEQLNNIVKYAAAKKVQIKLTSGVRHTVLEIKDNGRGFDMKKLKRGLGFINIRNRAEMLGGKKEIFSNPGKGCLVKVSLPIECRLVEATAKRK